MKKAYVIGSNVKKSLSPLIFEYWFKQNKIDGQYLSKEIEPDKFNEEIKKILKEDGVCGFNVTIPFKEIIVKKIDRTNIRYNSVSIRLIPPFSHASNKA